MSARRGRRLVDMTPEQQAAIGTMIAENRTPESRAEAERIRRLVREEFPPVSPDPEAVGLEGP